jgi:hypothetical protein
MKKTDRQNTILCELGEGLVLRRSTIADADALFDFNSRIHSEDGPEKPDERIGAWARDLLRGDHPTFGLGDFTIVEESETGKIVSSMNLISQTWAYEGIPFKVGRPEMVGTLPEYRNRGLVRKQFEVIHQWSLERGELLQAITGIPYYYRIFGYEMALNLSGGRAGYKPQVTRLKEGEEEAYTFRRVGNADISFINQTYRYGSQRYPVRCLWDEETLAYEILRKSQQNINRIEFRIIETKEGEPVGFMAHPGWNWDSMMPALLYELKEGISYGAVTPSVVRYLYRTGEDIAREKGKDDFDAFGFWLGRDHPVYQVMKNRLPNVRKPYAWYMRVADLPGFLRQVAPALEQRLAASPYASHTAEIKITFYKDGIRMVLEKGRLVTVEPYKPEPVGGVGDAGFPGLTFLQLLFGYRSLEELRYAFADCWTENDEITGLLEAMFPQRSSDIWAVS